MFRKERVAELLQGVISKNLNNMRDPRLNGISINAINLSPDLRHAKLYWCFLLEQDTDREKTQKALDGAEGFLRKKIAAELDLRHVPELIFKFDLAAETETRIDQLLDTLNPEKSNA